MKKSAINFIKENKSNEPILKVIFDMIATNKELNIKEIASKSYSSVSGVSRYFSNHGYQGFKEFKYLLLNEYKLLDEDYLTNIIEEDFFKKSFENIRLENNDENFEKIYLLLKEAKTIYFCGLGGNLSVIRELESKLDRLGFKTIFTEDQHLNYVKINNAVENDVLFCISYSGEKNELIKIMKLAKQKNLKTVTITGKFENFLANNSDVKLWITPVESRARIYSFNSRLEMLYLAIKITLYIYLKDEKFYKQLLIESVY